MVVKAKTTRPTVTTRPLPLRPALKAAIDRSAPPRRSPAAVVIVWAWVVMITRAVIVQITRVSMKVPSIATVPWRTGSSVRAAAWAMGALPNPASFEKIPRLNPIKIT